MFYTLIKHGFFYQSESTQGPIYVIKIIKQKRNTVRWEMTEKQSDPRVIYSSFHEIHEFVHRALWFVLQCLVLEACPWGATTNTRDRLCCALTFAHKGKSYKKCTMKNHNKLWYSLDSTYTWKWGNSGNENNTSFKLHSPKDRAILREFSDITLMNPFGVTRDTK